MSVKGEKYTSMAMKKKHEKMEGAKERKMEYVKIMPDKKVIKKAAVRKMVKK